MQRLRRGLRRWNEGGSSMCKLHGHPHPIDYMIMGPWGPPPTQALAIREQRITPTPSSWNKEKTAKMLGNRNLDLSPRQSARKKKADAGTIRLIRIRVGRWIVGADMTYNGRGNRRGGGHSSQPPLCARSSPGFKRGDS